jgi:hypothetical protein
MEFISLTDQQKKEHQKLKDYFTKKYNFKFYNPSYDSVPFVSNLINNKKAKERFSKIEYYLIGSYPINMNSNIGKEISEIKMKFTKDESKWIHLHNKLAPNRWGCLAGITLSSLNLLLKRDDLFIESRFLNPTEYNQISFDEKRKYVQDIDKKLYILLEKIYFKDK